ncbi:MAG TPA: hypothetical protein VIV11_35930 [Kofleriaceae bacterium]
MRWFVALCILVGCSRITTTPGEGTGDPPVALTVDRRPAAQGIARLEIRASGAGGDHTNELEVGDASFPFAYEVPLSGPVTITIDAFDTFDVLVGHGTTDTLGAETARVWVQGVDFAVNNVYAGDQFLTNDFEAVGLQLAAQQNFGTWMVGFRDDCTTCSIYGRRFNALGAPVLTDFAGGINQFELNATQTTASAMPALAGGSDRVAAFWDFTDASGTNSGIACRTVDFVGSSSPPVTITDEAADVVTAAYVPLIDGYVVTWQSFMASQVVRSAIVRPHCSLASPPVTVSVATGDTGARRSHAAAAQASTNILFTWILDGNAKVRVGDVFEPFVSSESTLLYGTVDQDVEYVRVVRWGNEYALAARWAAKTSMGHGKIEVYRVSETGQLRSSPIVITDAVGSDFASNKAFGLAARYDGTLMVVWHTCPQGAGTCDVYGRYVTPGAEVAGDPFIVATTTTGDQVNPSVAAMLDDFIVAWNDSSGARPDTSGQSVRARIIRPDS